MTFYSIYRSPGCIELVGEAEENYIITQAMRLVSTHKNYSLTYASATALAGHKKLPLINRIEELEISLGAS